MRATDIWLEALLERRRNGSRTIGGVIATMMGVASVVASLGLAASAQASVHLRFAELAQTSIEIQQTGQQPALEMFDDLALSRLRMSPGVTFVGRVKAPSALTLSALGQRFSDVPVLEADPDALRAWKVHISSGRGFSRADGAKGLPVALIGSAVRERLGVGLNDRLLIDGRSFTVVGIADAARNRREAVLSVIVPLRAGDRLGLVPHVRTELAVGVKTGYVPQLAASAPLILSPERASDLTVVALPEVATLENNVSGDLRTLLLGLGLLGLLGGTITISSTTLVATMQRTGEIAIRRAMGARRSHIAAQIFAECGDVGLFSGLAGCLLGVILVSATSLLQGWPPQVELLTLVSAPVLGLVVGLVAGVLPALRATRVDPATALAGP